MSQLQERSPANEALRMHRQKLTRNRIRNGIFCHHRIGANREVMPVEVVVYPRGGRDSAAKQWFDIYAVTYSDGSGRRYELLEAE